jgi:colanic acid biosynthesis glycosyl transferase WcaI
MKILIYSANFAPEPTGIGKYSGEMAAWLAENGHSVRVVAAPPYYPAWKVSKGYAWPPYRIEQWRGVAVWRAPLWVPSSPSGIARVVHHLSFALSSLPTMLWQATWRPDVVLTVAPAIVCAPAGWLTARLGGAKAWLHIQDFEVDVAFRMGLLKGKWSRKAVLWLEKHLLRRFDVVSSISVRMVQRLTDKQVCQTKQRFFPNWVDTQAITPLDRPSLFRASLGISIGNTVALFSGTWGNKQGLMVIPEAARLLQDRSDITFVIAGDGVMRPEIEAACQSLKNVRLLPLQPVDQLNELLGLADIHLLPQSPGAEDLVLPSKLTGMLSSGRPIIATCRADTEIANVVSQCGIVVEPENGRALADAIVSLATAPTRRAQLGQVARAYADEHLTQTAILGRLVDKMSELVRSEARPDDAPKQA